MFNLVNSHQLNPVAGPEAAGLLATILSHAFHYEPSFIYAMPDEETRRELSPWFFEAAIRATLLYGEIYTTETTDGGALWIRPEHDLTFGQMVRTGMTAVPFNLEWGISRRCMKLAASVDDVRKRLAPGPHWYLMALGVEWPDREDAACEGLMTPVLLKANATGIPCYLETFNEKKLGLYKNLGFRIAGAGRIPGGGPQFWAMTKP